MTLVARPATFADAAWLLRLRNNPATVEASIVQKRVTLTEHGGWLMSTLTNPRRRLMVVDFGGLVATYRLDGVGTDVIEVSLTVAPEARGRGLATPVIRLAAEHAVREGADVVVATIRCENEASCRAFRRAGFDECVTYTELPTSCTISYSIRHDAVAGWRCAACVRGVAHHTNSPTSIGRAGLRYPIYDVHEEPDGAYGFLTYECDAGDLLLAWERSRRRRLGEREPDYSIRPTVRVEEGR